MLICLAPPQPDMLFNPHILEQCQLIKPVSKWDHVTCYACTSDYTLKMSQSKTNDFHFPQNIQYLAKTSTLEAHNIVKFKII